MSPLTSSWETSRRRTNRSGQTSWTRLKTSKNLRCLQSLLSTAATKWLCWKSLGDASRWKTTSIWRKSTTKKWIQRLLIQLTLQRSLTTEKISTSELALNATLRTGLMKSLMEISSLLFSLTLTQSPMWPRSTVWTKDVCLFSSAMVAAWLALARARLKTMKTHSTWHS